MFKANAICILFSLVLLAGCSSSPKVAAPSVGADAQYAIKNFTFNLIQKREVEGYATQEELSLITHDLIVSELKAGGILADAADAQAVPLSITINYQRRFSGEDTPFPSKSVTNPIVGYTIIVLEDGAEKARISKAGLTANRGFLANLKTVATMDIGNDSKVEEADIQRVAKTIVAELQKLRQ